MSDDVQFMGSTVNKGTRYAKFSMQMGSTSAIFQQSAQQLRENINKMEELGKPPVRIAIFQQGLDAIEEE